MLKELQIVNKFKDVYVDYRFYALQEVNSKCQEKLVNLPQRHLKKYKNVMAYIQQTPIPTIKQCMAICYARPVVFTKNSDHPPKTETDIREMIAITLRGTPSVTDILVFHKEEKSSKYLPYKAYITTLHYQNNVNPVLFNQHPPTGTRTGFRKIFKDSEEVLIARYVFLFHFFVSFLFLVKFACYSVTY